MKKINTLFELRVLSPSTVNPDIEYIKQFDSVDDMIWQRHMEMPEQLNMLKIVHSGGPYEIIQTQNNSLISLWYGYFGGPNNSERTQPITEASE